jgi:hypothetical protein
MVERLELRSVRYPHAAFLLDRAVDAVGRVLKTALDFGLALQ